MSQAKSEAEEPIPTNAIMPGSFSHFFKQNKSE